MHRTVEPPVPRDLVDEDVSYVLRNVAIAFTVIELFFVALRFIAKYIAKKPFGIDDILIIPSLLVCLGLNATALYSISHAKIGRSPLVVAIAYPDAIVLMQKLIVVLAFLWAIACALPRIVMLALYLRIFVVPWQRIACYVLMALAVCEAITCIILDLIQCVPLAKLWDSSLPGVCHSSLLVYRWAPVPNIAIDVLMLALPFPTIWKLCASRRAKFGLAVTFLTGSVGLVTAIMRTVIFFGNTYNYQNVWSPITFISWSIIEPGVYLIAACLPSYRPLINFIFSGKSWRSSRHTGRTDEGGSSNLRMSPVARRPHNGQAYRLSSRDGKAEVQVEVTEDVHTKETIREGWHEV